MFRAGGWNGQEIMIFVELDIVIVFMGGNYDKKTSLYKLLEKYILPAIKLYTQHNNVYEKQARQ